MKVQRWDASEAKRARYIQYYAFISVAVIEKSIKARELKFSKVVSEIQFLMKVRRWAASEAKQSVASLWNIKAVLPL